MFVVAFKVTVSTGIMWTSVMAPQGSAFTGLLSAHAQGVKTQHRREFGLGVLPQSSLSSQKTFKNPNFVNDFDKYQRNFKPFDTTEHRDSRNSSQRHLIDSIKEKCPEAIPNAVEEEPNQEFVSSILKDKCTGQGEGSSMPKLVGREPKRRHKRMSRQNLKRQEINERLQADNFNNLSNQSLDVSSSPLHHTLILNDFIISKPSPTPPINIPAGQSSIEMLIKVKGSSSPPLTTKYSLTDSEDSFIVFAKTEDQNNKSGTSPCLTRRPSYCGSEDSFVIFEHDDDQREDDSGSFTGESSGSSDWEEDTEEELDRDFDEVDFCQTADTTKKVSFATEDKLCEIHPMIKWSYAYQAARKGPWEMYARDRSRFRDRALKVERDIKHVFDPQHRERIYQQRFENRE